MGLVLITGASGFVGRSLLFRLLKERTHEIKVASRRLDLKLSNKIEQILIEDLGSGSTWGRTLENVDVVIHAAGCAHILNDKTPDVIDSYRRVNVEGTLNLARQAANSGVRRFIYISSIGVNGIESNGVRFSENSIASPHSPYAVSKYEAELGLQAIEKCTPMEVVIIRPPLIYGPGPPGNLARLLRIISLGWPLPFGLVKNKRTLISLHNMVDLVTRCIDHVKAAGEIFLAGDSEDVSTPELIEYLAAGMSKRVIQLPVPMKVLETGARVFRQQAMFKQLCSSLQIDSAKAHTLLGWNPPIHVHEGLIETGYWYKKMSLGIKSNADIFPQ